MALKLLLASGPCYKKCNKIKISVLFHMCCVNIADTISLILIDFGQVVVYNVLVATTILKQQQILLQVRIN